MKKLLPLLLLLAFARFASAQIDTTGGRYYQPIFPNVTATLNVVYGSAVNSAGQTQQLVMDVYQPTGDVLLRRPLIIFAHQGGFVTGTRNEAYMVAICTRFARLGYVTASIDYRLIDPVTVFTNFDTVAIAKGALRGGQDMKAAIRYFRNDAATTNTYRIQSQYIAVGGASAGAFMALQTGYLDKLSEIPAYVDAAALGGVEGTGGNPGYSSRPLAVINLSGATENASLIEANDPPLCSLHGTNDAVVPYGRGRVGSNLPPKYVWGSAVLHPRTTQLGIRNVFKTFQSAGHIPQYGTSTSALAYADTTFRVVRDFLRPALGTAGTVLATSTSRRTAPLVQAYPVPANEAVRLVLPEAWVNRLEAQLLDQAGRVVRRIRPESSNLEVLRGSLKAGIYSLKFPGQDALRIEFK